MLPQKAVLDTLIAELSALDRVRALWLGGSLARGEGDAHSDIDLRVALTAHGYDDAQPSPWLEARTVAGLTLRFGPRTLYHRLLDDGTIVDLLVQPDDVPPDPEARVLLAVKDDALAQRLAGGADPAPPTFPPVAPETIERLLQGFWIGQRKHLKVLARGLSLVAWQGEHFLRLEVLKLLYLDATGRDGGNEGGTIHVLSPIARAVEEKWGERALALLGTPRTTVDEMVTHMVELQDFVAALGRDLCARHGAVYPEAAEATVRRLWAGFTAGSG